MRRTGLFFLIAFATLIAIMTLALAYLTQGPS